MHGEANTATRTGDGEVARFFLKPQGRAAGGAVREHVFARNDFSPKAIYCAGGREKDMAKDLVFFEPCGSIARKHAKKEVNGNKKPEKQKPNTFEDRAKRQKKRQSSQ